MPRYFIEVSYKGTLFAGFQVQDNANTIQAEVEKALGIYFRKTVTLTGSSRTDAGVHAFQNFFHFDFEEISNPGKLAYHLNAILPPDIAVKEIRLVPETAHSRFDAVSRTYEYRIYAHKDPFLADRAYYYPYKIDIRLMNEAAAIILGTKDFASFSKRNTQVKTSICSISESEWTERNGLVVYRVTGNRFLRGMVRGLVGTMLKVGRKSITIDEFRDIISSGDPSKADFSMPAHGLVLLEVRY